MEGLRPAQLCFLAIYNPFLGRTDETLHDQVVYYYASKLSKARRAPSEAGEQQEREEKNERLRQIGLAQGMVEFAKAFSSGESIDAIDAEKSRILLHEFEPGWWILASVDLTRLQSAPASSKSKAAARSEPTVEYSAREVCSQDLLLQHLLRAHAVFLLHQAASLSDLYVRLTRQKFCAALERFWNRFIRDWDILLHGNPSVEIFNGLKLAAGGELGIGVGEEEWGSGEREVLEGFIGRTDGLIDIVVSRFGGDDDNPIEPSRGKNKDLQWLGSGSPPSSADGVIFSGIGAVTRPCLRSVSAWMEWIYRYGAASYGVQENPHSGRRRKRKKPSSPPAQTAAPSDTESRPQPTNLPKPGVGTKTDSEKSLPTRERSPGIAPPIARAVDNPTENRKSDADESTGAETLVKYMTLGIYGSHWGIPAGRPGAQKHSSELHDFAPAEASEGESKLRQMEPQAYGGGSDTPDTTNGCFLIGLQGDLEQEEIDDEEAGTDAETGPEPDTDTKSTWNRRIMLRTLYIERVRSFLEINKSPDEERHKKTFFDRVRVVLYVRRPFIFTFLFSTSTSTLTMTALYRSLHHQLGPLQRPLATSTSPANVRARLHDALPFPRTISSSATGSTAPIFDLIFDPAELTVHTTLPGIPEPGSLASEGLAGDGELAWARADALNVHGQILHMVTATRATGTEIERTAKTSRGWWVVWMRLAPERGVDAGVAGYREAFLVRMAGDHRDAGNHGRKTSWGGGKGDEGRWGGAGRVAEGIGIDARKYVEGLLGLSR